MVYILNLPQRQHNNVNDIKASHCCFVTKCLLIFSAFLKILIKDRSQYLKNDA